MPPQLPPPIQQKRFFPTEQSLQKQFIESQSNGTDDGKASESPQYVGAKKIAPKTGLLGCGGLIFGLLLCFTGIGAPIGIPLILGTLWMVKKAQRTNQSELDKHKVNVPLCASGAPNTKAVQPRFWPTILLLIFFFPVGLWLLWHNSRFGQKSRIVITAFVGILVLLPAVPNHEKAPPASSPSFSPKILEANTLRVTEGEFRTSFNRIATGAFALSEVPPTSGAHNDVFVQTLTTDVGMILQVDKSTGELTSLTVKWVERTTDDPTSFCAIAGAATKAVRPNLDSEILGRKFEKLVEMAKLNSNVNGVQWEIYGDLKLGMLITPELRSMDFFVEANK
jgi:hypothetical protein